MLKIVTHGGKAHLDDLMACAVATAHLRVWRDNAEVTVERRDPTPDELGDSGVLVLDVGGKYEPEKGNFDHHQLPRGSKDSAMTLLAANLGLPDGAFGGEYAPGDGKFPADSMAEALEQLFPWFRRRAELDSCGPFAAAKAAGTDWETVSQFLGPCEQLVLDAFEREPARVACLLGDTVAEKLEALAEVERGVKVERPWWADGEFAIADFTACDPAKAEIVSGAVTAKVNGVAVFHDNRGAGLTLLRLRDDPRVDFTRVKDDPEVAFAHAGGFVVKTKSKDLEKAWRLIEDAFAPKA